MTKAFRFYETGGSDVLKFEDVEVGAPGEGEVRLAQKAVGLNYIDIYFRSGVYPAPSMPSGLGLEGAGIIEEVGPGVTDLAVGDRVHGTSVGAAAADRTELRDTEGLRGIVVKWQIGEDLTNSDTRTKLLCDQETVPTIFTKPRLECVRNR